MQKNSPKGAWNYNIPPFRKLWPTDDEGPTGLYGSCNKDLYDTYTEHDFCCDEGIQKFIFIFYFYTFLLYIYELFYILFYARMMVGRNEKGGQL